MTEWNNFVALTERDSNLAQVKEFWKKKNSEKTVWKDFSSLLKCFVIVYTGTKIFCRSSLWVFFSYLSIYLYIFIGV